MMMICLPPETDTPPKYVEGVQEVSVNGTGSLKLELGETRAARSDFGYRIPHVVYGYGYYGPPRLDLDLFPSLPRKRPFYGKGEARAWQAHARAG